MRVSSPLGLVAATMGVLMLVGAAACLQHVFKDYLPARYVTTHDVARLRPLTAGEMARTAVGTKALVVGRLSASNRVDTLVGHDKTVARFVAYGCSRKYLPERERWRGRLPASGSAWPT